MESNNDQPEEAENFLVSPQTLDLNSVLVQDMSRMFYEKIATDTTIIIGKQRFYAHRLILCIRSRYFQMMFNSGLAESNQNQVVINEDEQSAELFGRLLQYIYTGRINFTSFDELIQLLISADFYMFYELATVIMNEIMWYYLDHTNVIKLYKMAQHYHLTPLQEGCRDYILENGYELIQNRSLMELEIDNIISLLENDWFCCLEKDIGLFVFDYIRHHADKNQEQNTNTQPEWRFEQNDQDECKSTFSLSEKDQIRLIKAIRNDQIGKLDNFAVQILATYDINSVRIWSENCHITHGIRRCLLRPCEYKGNFVQGQVIDQENHPSEEGYYPDITCEFVTNRSILVSFATKQCFDQIQCYAETQYKPFQLQYELSNDATDWKHVLISHETVTHQREGQYGIFTLPKEIYCRYIKISFHYNCPQFALGDLNGSFWIRFLLKDFGTPTD